MMCGGLSDDRGNARSGILLAVASVFFILFFLLFGSALDLNSNFRLAGAIVFSLIAADLLLLQVESIFQEKEWTKYKMRLWARF
jgi:hypothetical protein